MAVGEQSQCQTAAGWQWGQAQLQLLSVSTAYPGSLWGCTWRHWELTGAPTSPRSLCWPPGNDLLLCTESPALSCVRSQTLSWHCKAVTPRHPKLQQDLSWPKSGPECPSRAGLEALHHCWRWKAEGRSQPCCVCPTAEPGAAAPHVPPSLTDWLGGMNKTCYPNWNKYSNKNQGFCHQRCAHG